MKGFMDWEIMKLSISIFDVANNNRTLTVRNDYM